MRLFGPLLVLVGVAACGDGARTKNSMGGALVDDKLPSTTRVYRTVVASSESAPAANVPAPADQTAPAPEPAPAPRPRPRAERPAVDDDPRELKASEARAKPTPAPSPAPAAAPVTMTAATTPTVTAPITAGATATATLGAAAPAPEPPLAAASPAAPPGPDPADAAPASAPSARVGFKNVPPDALEPLRVAGRRAPSLPDSVVVGARADHVGLLTLTVAICVGPDGVPSTVDLVAPSGNRAADEHVLGQVREWRFRPYLVGDRPIRVCTRIPLRYQLG